MKVKYLRKNIKNVKKALKQLAKDYKVNVKFVQYDNKRIMFADFSFKKSRKEEFVKIVQLSEDKIAYGLYKPALVTYNVERQLIDWLHETR